MDGSDENHHTGVTSRSSSSYQGGLRMEGGANFSQQATRNHRRALTNISQNVIGATLYPAVVNERVLLEKGVNRWRNKFASETEHKPVTRKIAAQLIRNQKPCPEALSETKKVEPTDSKHNGLTDCTIIDVDEFEYAADIPVPMFVKNTEALMDEIDNHMVEVEMEDVEEDLVLDIDSSDLKNPLAVVDYIEDIYAYYRRTENSGCVFPNYMVHQFDINEKMRAILIDWLVEVHYKFKLVEETLFLTVNLIDRFLEHQTVVRKKLQLVGVTAMLLACKYEEVSVPSVEDFVLISDMVYTGEEVIDMEKQMLNMLQFKMCVPTACVFMRRFLKAAQNDQMVELLCFFIIELCLVEYEMLKFPPSLMAAAAIYTAQFSLHRSKQWTKTLEWYTKYSEEQLKECSRLMVCFHQKAGTGKLNGVHKKYSTCKLSPMWQTLNQLSSS